MLTADLVEARVRKGAVVPRWIDPDDPVRLALAETLIAAVEGGLGHSLGEVTAELEELSGTATEFRFHRALTKLLFDRCSFETVSPADPQAVREAVFAAAADAWGEDPRKEDPLPFRFDRARVLETAGAACRDRLAPDAASPDAASPDAASPDAAYLDAASLDAALYADLKHEQRLTVFEPCTARWLLDRYNLALAQGVLLRASELTVRVSGQTARDYRALFRKIKFFRLLHRIEPLSGGDDDDEPGPRGYEIHLDGPLSLFRASQRYGLQMASFLPTLVHFDGWRLDARVRWGRGRQERTFRLTPQSAPLRPIGKLTGRWQPDEVEVLGRRLSELESSWKVLADAELIDLGADGVLVPDLAFEHRETGRRAYLEVLGYWNRGAVATRLAQLKRSGPPGLVVAVSKALAAGEGDLDEIAAQLYVYTKTPSAPKILAALDQTLHP